MTKCVWRMVAASIAMVAASPEARAMPPDVSVFEPLRAADLRLATIFDRLVIANAALCAQRQPALGMVVHALDQYSPDEREAADKAFGFDAMLAVEAVVPDGAAARAGLVAGDSLVALNDTRLPDEPGDRTAPATVASRTAFQRLVTGLVPDAPVRITVRRAGREQVATLHPVSACHANAELLLGTGFAADSSGSTIRISAKHLEEFDDVDIAVTLAHELAHTVLQHEARLTEARVATGLFAEIGRNARLWQRVEDEADRLSVYLLYNAGYDPQAGAGFWQRHGARLGQTGLFRGRTHASAPKRMRAMSEEAAKIPSGAPRPVMPEILSQRTLPLR